MADAFTILILSDTHIGKPETDHDAKEVLKPLLDDIRAVIIKYDLDIGAIVFAGDLVYGQTPKLPLKKQFEHAKIFLSDVCEAAGSELGSLPLLIAPGNHDLDRNLVDDGQKLWTDKIREDENAVEKVQKMMQRNTISWRRNLERQSEWWSFVKSLPGKHWIYDDELHLSYGTIDTHQGIIAFYSFNTAWASFKKDEMGKLWMGMHQLQKANSSIGKNDFKVAVMHHPLTYLNSYERTSLAHRIETTFNIRIHGHEHSGWFKPLDGHLTIESGTAYSGASKTNGYCFLSINKEANKASLFMREYSNDGSGTWKERIIPGKPGYVVDRYQINNLFPSANSDVIPEHTSSIETPELHVEKSGSQGLFYSIFKLKSNEQITKTVLDYISVLENDFRFRWEPSTFDRSDKDPIVYWPIRLRSPSPIHAAQTIAAAGLQLRGARIVLSVDDLGDAEYDSALLTHAIRVWFRNAGANPEDLEIKLFSEIVNVPSCKEAWHFTQNWLGETTDKLERILKISKLYIDGEELGDLLQRRPRRLLSPAMVWACLVKLSSDWGDNPVITLGGYDEFSLWQYWRQCFANKVPTLGHLYIPELKQIIPDDGKRTIHMDTTPLNWTSKDDIFQCLKREIEMTSGDVDFFSDTPMLAWVASLCVLLPTFATTLKGQVLSLESVTNSTDNSKIIQAVTDAAGDWLFT